MEPEPEPTPRGHQFGQHGLGPHVVGQRVVVRRVVPDETGPTGGPALTDVLGVCERWGDGEAVVRREDGTTVTIRTDLIVSGKPVPTRPSRLDRIGDDEIDRRLDGPASSRWLGSVTQLSRSSGAAAEEVEYDESGPRLVVSLGPHRASAVEVAGWVRVDQLSHPDLFPAVVEWAAERGLAILLLTDPAAAEVAETLGLVSR